MFFRVRIAQLPVYVLFSTSAMLTVEEFQFNFGMSQVQLLFIIGHLKNERIWPAIQK